MGWISINGKRVHTSCIGKYRSNESTLEILLRMARQEFKLRYQLRGFKRSNTGFAE